MGSNRGPIALRSLNDTLAKEGFTGYLRVSMFGKDQISEGVIVYRAGKPVMSFVSDGAVDHVDEEARTLEAFIGTEGSTVEVCRLVDRQVELLLELYHEFAISLKPGPAQAGPKAEPAPAGQPEPCAAPPRKPQARPAPAAGMPDIRGRFVRSEPAGSVGEYLRRHPGETGHLLFAGKRDGRAEECHIIIIGGQVEIAYNEDTVGPHLAEGMADGTVEFYAVDPPVLASVLARHLKKEGVPQEAGVPQRAGAPKREEPAGHADRPVLGIPARALLEKSGTPVSPVKEDINRAVDEISNSMDDDVAMVRKVERDFAGHVDDLLSKLELSHLRQPSPRRKR
jgi:hypothetical protein